MSTKQRVINTLQMIGVDRKYIHRSIKLHEKHYGVNYNIEVIIEIIYRLRVKDKLKQQKGQTIFRSKEQLEAALVSMDFSEHYIYRAFNEYMKRNRGLSEYDLSVVVEIIMNLRAEDKLMDEQQRSHSRHRKFSIRQDIIALHTPSMQQAKSADAPFEHPLRPRDPPQPHPLSPPVQHAYASHGHHKSHNPQEEQQQSRRSSHYRHAKTLNHINVPKNIRDSRNSSGSGSAGQTRNRNRSKVSKRSKSSDPHRRTQTLQHGHLRQVLSAPDMDDIKVKEDAAGYPAHSPYLRPATRSHIERKKRQIPQFVEVRADEPFSFDSCGFFVAECASFRRINYVLFVYRDWLANQTHLHAANHDHRSRGSGSGSSSKHSKTKIGFCDILNQLNYANSVVLDDYHHLIYYHEFDEIYKHLASKCCEEDANRVIGCKCLIRNHRNRSQQQNVRHYTLSYFDNDDSQQVNVEQIMDMMHCYFLHSYHLGHTLRPQEVATLHEQHQRRQQQQETAKDMLGDTVQIQTIQRFLAQKRKRIEFLRGSHRFATHNKFVSVIKQTPCILHKQLGIEYDYYDPHKEFYCAPKFQSLKEESLQLIPVNEWKVLQLRAKNLHAKKHSKNLMADDIVDFCRIEEGSLMFLEHLVSMLIYTNFDKIQSQFVATCVYVHPPNDDDDDGDDEDGGRSARGASGASVGVSGVAAAAAAAAREAQYIRQLLQRHTHFHHLGKRLFESVWVFGAATTAEDIFYHGLTAAAHTYFSSTMSCLSVPLSTSSKVEVALNYVGCHKENGLVLQLKQNGVYSMMKYFDCSWISDFGAESELFFHANSLGSGHTFNINTIYSISATSVSQPSEYGEDYRDYLICLNVVDKIFNAGYYFGVQHLSAMILDKTVDLLNSELHHDISDHADHEHIPKYVLYMVHCYCKHLKVLKLNWPDLLHYYAFISSFLCYKNDVFVNLRVVVPIFTNCVKIQIHGGSPSILQLNQEKMTYIYSYLYQNRNRVDLKQIEITSIADSSELTFDDCVQQFKKRFNNINCDIFIQNASVYGAPTSLVITV